MAHAKSEDAPGKWLKKAAGYPTSPTCVRVG